MTGAPMSDFILPAPNAPGEEWGRLAVSIPGCRWMPGMLGLHTGLRLDELTLCWEAEAPDPDDPATAGCLLALLGSEAGLVMLIGRVDGFADWYDGIQWREDRLPLGRACIAAAEALGRWPGGDHG